MYDENGNVDGPGGIKERLENLSRQAKGGRHESRIIIKNKCDYSLEKTNEGGFNGDFWANYPEEAFKVRGNDYLIPSGAAGGIFYKSTRFSLWGTKGYVSIRISTHGRNYIVICAFSTGSASRNSARIVIRCEDGATNELGVILGHGVDPTGTVTNRDELLAECDQHNTSSKLKRFNLKARMFNVYCQFENTPQAYFYFTFTNNEDASRNPNPAPAPQPRPKPDEDSKPRPVAPLVITIDGSLVDCFKTMRPGISERNHNPKTEKKAEMPVPDQEPVKDNLSGMSDNMQGDGDESAPGVPPQAEDERKVSNNSEYFENISTKASDFINNIDSEFISAAKPLANLLGKKLFDSPKEPKKEDKQNESSE